MSDHQPTLPLGGDDDLSASLAPEPAPGGVPDELLGRLALGRGLLAVDALRRFQADVDRAIAAGEPPPRLGRRLLDAGAVSARELAALLREARLDERSGVDDEATLGMSGVTVSGAPQQLSSGDTLGHYTILRRLAMGGMGVVYQALDMRLERQVCLKLLLGDPGARRLARLEREAKSTGKLQHPTIVRLHGLEEHDGTLFLVLDYVHGWPLDQYAKLNTLDDAWILGFFDALLDGVSAMHRQGVIHRDFKPANVIVTPEGKPRIIDFSLAKLTDSGPDEALTVEGVPMGTPAYMPPEQVKGDLEVTPAADIYALGVMLFELLAGEPPFRGESADRLFAKILHGEPTPLETLRPDLAPGLVAAIGRALAREPADRFQSPAAFARALRRRGASVRPAPSRRLQVALAAALLLIGGIAGIVGVRARPAATGLPSMIEAAAPRGLRRPLRALERELAERRLARFARHGAVDDLLAAVRLDARHGAVLREHLAAWRASRQDDRCLEALGALWGPHALTPAEAEDWLRLLLARAASLHEFERGWRVGWFFRSRHPQVAYRVEHALQTRLLEGFGAGAPDGEALRQLLYLVGVTPLTVGWPGQLVSVARKRYDRLRYQQALGLINFVSRLPDGVRPIDWQVDYVQGLLSQVYGRHELALTQFAAGQRAARGQRVLLDLHRGVTLFVMGRQADARRVLDTLARRLPGAQAAPWRQLCELMVAAVDAGSPSADEATRGALQRAVEAMPPGHFASLQTHYRPAVDVFAVITRALPDCPAAWLHRAQAQLDIGDREGARASIARARALPPPAARWREWLFEIEGRLAR